MSNNKKSRLHIKTVLTEYFDISDGELLNGYIEKDARTKELLMEYIKQYQVALVTYGSKIIEHGKSIFEI